MTRTVLFGVVRSLFPSLLMTLIYMSIQNYSMLSSAALLSAKSEVSIGLERAQKESLESIGLSLVHLGQLLLEHAADLRHHHFLVKAGAVFARRAVFFLLGAAPRLWLVVWGHALFIHMLFSRHFLELILDGCRLSGEEKVDSHLCCDDPRLKWYFDSQNFKIYKLIWKSLLINGRQAPRSEISAQIAGSYSQPKYTKSPSLT